MILCLDVGNTTIHGGVFERDQLKMQFRRTSEFRASSDELGMFLRGVLRENGVDPAGIEQIAFCSVVPDAIHSLRNCCLKYFNKSPFILQAGVKSIATRSKSAPTASPTRSRPRTFIRIAI
jgi:type III pantothenate kinase